MHKLSREQLAALVKVQRIKPRIAKELRFNPEDVAGWDELELLALKTRSGADGVLLVQAAEFCMAPFELRVGLRDNATGRSKPVVCDFCYTWQHGGKAARITFARASDGHLLSYLCCADLLCSLHVRDKTPESILSRTQLHEDIRTEQRVVRLRGRLQSLMLSIGAEPVADPPL